MAIFNIGKDFSTDPQGRYYSDETGSSGEEFRELHLKPRIELLESDEKLEIILDDGVESYGSSFLVEGFGGMVKYGYIRSDVLLSKLQLTFSDEDFAFYRDKIVEYISAAKFNSKSYVSTKNK